MKGKWKRGCRGAISIFLIIIFVAQYVLCGLLVDGARHKMAEAMAESALDSASTSILSYYDQLLFDLYGLMGTDSLSTEQINEKLQYYVEQTLGLATPDSTSVRSLVSTVMGAFQTATGGSAGGSSFDGYDFQIKVSGEPAVNLANTDFVEYQLIEHMKYRAPMYMLQSEDGLLSKLKGLVDIKDRIKAASDRMAVTNEYASVGAAAAETMDSIADLSQQVRSYVTTPSTSPIGHSISGAVTVADVLTYASAFDTKVDKVIEEYQKRQEEYEEALEDYESELEAYNEAKEADPEYDGDPPTKPEKPEPWTAEDWKDALSEEYEAMETAYTAVLDNAETLKISAEEHINNIDTGVGNYGKYVEDLNKNLKNNGGEDNANAATVFLPEIELAEANAGQLLKNRPFLTCVTTFTGDIIDTRNNVLTRMSSAYQEIITQLYTNEGNEEISFTTMKSRLSSHLSGMTGGLNQLNYALSDALIVKPAQIDVRTGASVDTKKAKDKVKDENPGEDLRNIKAENLKVEFEEDNSADLGSFKMEDSTKEGSQLLDAASSLVDTLVNLLESARDSLYLNQYIVSYFPNYVDNFKKTEGASDMTKKFNSGGLYAPYCANQVEVEYVLTGQPDGRLSVVEVQAMLLGIRTAFNLIAIFTDAAKINQANAIAAAISGPFAPAVAIVLLIAWATAESVIDVNELCNGGKVPLFKQGGEWTCSVEGAAKKGITAGVEYLTGVATDKINSLANSISGQVKSTVDTAIYKAFTAAEDSVNGCVKEATEAMDSWKSNMTKGLDESGDPNAAALSDAIDGINNSIKNNMVTPVGNRINSGLSTVKDKALLQVSKAAEKVDAVVTEKVNMLGDKVSEELTGKLSSWISDKIPVGDVVSLEGTPAESGGKFSVDMSYMDYIQIFLLLKSNTKKTQRIQELIQANIRYKEVGGDATKVGTYSLKERYGAIQSSLTGSIKFLFMSEPIVPAELRQDGRLKFSVNSFASY